MTIYSSKMRIPLERVSKTARKESRMKNITSKKKKVRITKAMNDSIAETISSVIKGHLTPLKSTVVAKKTNVGKRKLKVPVKNKTTASSPKGSPKKVPVRKKTVREVSKTKTPKKSTVKKNVVNSKIKTTPKVIKSAISNRKSQKKNTAEALNSVVTSQGDTVKPVLTNHAANKIKNEVKTSKLTKNDAKRRQSPSKGESVETVKQVKDEKPEINTKKKKSDNTSNKNNAIHDKIGTKQKSETAKLKQDVKDKPKKNRVSSLEPKEVKEDIKPVVNKTPKNNIVKDEIIPQESETSKQKPKQLVKKQIKKKDKSEETPVTNDYTSSTSDEITLDELRQHNTPKIKLEAKPKKVASKLVTVKKVAVAKRKLIQNSQEKKSTVKPKMVVMKKSVLPLKNNKAKQNEEQKSRKLKLYSLWNSPKRHRVASLNALAKVHCLYENETRGALLDNDMGKMGSINTKVEAKEEDYDEEDEEEEEEEVIPTRTLRSAPGLRGVGKHWDMHDEGFSSSEENDSSVESVGSPPKNEKPEEEKKPEKKRPYVKRRRNRCELIMDLKDMVVRKRMASLNASAILAASYSVEKRATKSPRSEETDSDDSEESYMEETHNKKKCFEEDVKKEDDHKVIEVQTTPNKKVSVILNQDTDVTITGVYVNSTTRSTHHEGYCSIAGMQYRISAKSHTQTASTTVATETILQTAPNISQENTNTNTPTHPCKSYTPLSALSSMQPPGTPSQHGVPLATPQHITPQHVIPHSAQQHVAHTSPIGRRHGCPSAFSAPPSGPYGPPPPAHHHHPTTHPPNETSYIHGYYQPAGPLINVPSHGHSQPSSLGKPAPLSEISSSPTPPPSHQARSQSSTADSMDSDVIITSATTVKESLPTQPPPPPPTYRYSQYPAPHPGYSYSYPPQYYPAPSYHHELCYPPNPYLHHKTYPHPAYRRHLTPPTGTQYYQANPPDLYHPPPSAPNQQSQQVVSTNSVSSSSYQPPPSGPPPLMESYPPPPTLVEPYPPPHYYPGYGPAPPPVCYTHSSPTRTIPYINAAYQSCPCPMQSCPKNVHTGPLTGDSKRSSHISSIAKDSLPLPPVALALPLEPVSATGPPSPARGSAGMPPPPSPAGATYQPPPPAPKQEGIDSLDCKPIEKKRKARIGKNMVRNNIAANFPENTMLLMCHPPTQHNIPVTDVKREIESPQEQKNSLEELKTKEDAPEITIITAPQTKIDTLCVKTQEEDVTVPFMKTEEQTEKLVSTNTESSEIQEKAAEELLPCQKTVAENVKVKNMKRKLSVTKELEKIEPTLTPPPQKKLKVDKAKANGSYKDLIKKNVPSIRINNGKRKLNNIDSDKIVLIKKAKLKYKKNPVKRKSSPSKEEINCKRLKSSKPLITSNLHNSKQNFKSNKSKCLVVDFALTENKESFLKTSKRLQVNSKHSINNNNRKKKLAPAILDSLFARNNVDRTIECVVSSYSENLRTTKKTETSVKLQEKCKSVKELPVNTKSTNSKSEQFKPKVVVSKKVGASKRKTKSRSVDVPQVAISKVPKKHMQLPRWSNGWVWKGEPFWSKVFLNSDETIVVRKCYPAMKHAEGDVIEPRDCVLLKAGQRKNELPFVAKVAALWENPEDGEMMMSLLWYYRPEHTDQGRQPCDESDEVFASRHKDTNSVACIEDKCYVLTFNEYCRYRKMLKRAEEGMEDVGTCIPNPEPYPRMQRQPPATLQTSSDLIFFCRRVYDFRQKRIIKNPS